MTARTRDARPSPARRLLAAAVLCVAAAGCRSTKDGGGGSFRDRDPLLGNVRIPPQNLPVYGRDADGKDPLLGGRENAKADDPPPRRRRDRDREPFRPGPDTTPAGLVGGNRDEPLTASIGDRRPDGTPAGRGPVPLTPGGADRAAPAGVTWEQAAARLRDLRAKWDGPTRTADGYSLACEVPRDGNPPTLRRYEGVGPTPAAAALDAVEQITGDRK